jgi:DNA polymerase III delta prime subunit
MLNLDDKYRPRTFEAVEGQEEQVTLLAKQVANPAPPTILLYGPPGTGKTTLARIYAMARHCLQPQPSPCGECARCREGLDAMKLYEFSGARWNEAKVAKDVEVLLRTVPWGNYGIFIDEVHGLDGNAADVLLKEAETYRPGRFLICATTDLEAVRPALRSRCLLLPLRLLKKSQLFKLAQRVCAAEGIRYEVGALDILVSLARGSPRELLKAIEAVASRGHLTPALLKTALSLGWTDELLHYARSLLGSDLEAQFDAIDDWNAPAGMKAQSIKEFLLYVYNHEASNPRIGSVVNSAFHLIEGSDRADFAAGIASRAIRDGFSLLDYWQQILNFWLLDPSLMRDDASLSIKLHHFHRLLTPGPDLEVPVSDPRPVAARQRQYRSRSRRDTAGRQSGSAGGATRYLGLKDAERLADAADLLGQHYGCRWNGLIELKVSAAHTAIEQAAKEAITCLTHELGLRVNAWAGSSGERGFHWIYRNGRISDTIHCRLAVHIPYDHLDAAGRWLSAKDWKMERATAITVSSRFHDPRPANTKARETSRRNFHWHCMRELWAALDPAIRHWGADGTRQPMRQLLRLKGPAEASQPMKIKLVGKSHSLGSKVRASAEANRMGLLSAFRDAAWGHIDSGWELLEYRDRQAETAERSDQLQRIEHIGAGDNALAQKRYTEEIEALLRQWPDDPRDRPRTWTPWWSERESAS